MANVTQTLIDGIAALEAAGLAVELDGDVATVSEPNARKRGAHVVIEGGYRDSGRGVDAMVGERENVNASGAFRARVREILAADLASRVAS